MTPAVLQSLWEERVSRPDDGQGIRQSYQHHGSFDALERSAAWGCELCIFLLKTYVKLPSRGRRFSNTFLSKCREDHSILRSLADSSIRIIARDFADMPQKAVIAIALGTADHTHPEYVSSKPNLLLHCAKGTVSFYGSVQIS